MQVFSLFLLIVTTTYKKKYKYTAWWILMTWKYPRNQYLDQETELDYHSNNSPFMIWALVSQCWKNLSLLLTWHIFVCVWNVNSITFYVVSFNVASFSQHCHRSIYFFEVGPVVSSHLLLCNISFHEYPQFFITLHSQHFPLIIKILVICVELTLGGRISAL